MLNSTVDVSRDGDTFLLLDLRALEMPPMAMRIPMMEVPNIQPHFHWKIRVDWTKQTVEEMKKAKTTIQVGSDGWYLASRKKPNSRARKILKNGILLHIPSCSFFLA